MPFENQLKITFTSNFFFFGRKITHSNSNNLAELLQTNQGRPIVKVGAIANG